MVNCTNITQVEHWCYNADSGVIKKELEWDTKYSLKGGKIAIGSNLRPCLVAPGKVFKKRIFSYLKY